MTTTRPADNRPSPSRPLGSGPARSMADDFDALFSYGADARGYSTEGDVLVNQTSDGVDLNTIWAEAQTAMGLWNQKRSALASLISYSTTNSGDVLAQAVGGQDFEKASEFGEPKGIRTAPDALILGYTFDDWDLAARSSWRYLRAATAEQVRSVINDAFEADNRLVTGTILRRLFDPAQGTNEYGQPVFGLYNGMDGMVPPPHAGQEFPSVTSHYLVSGNTALDPGDLTDAITQVQSKGFGTTQNSRLLVLCHPHEGEMIASFRAGEIANGVESRYDFIPSASAPAYLTPDNVVGQVAPGEFAGLEVLGSFGPAWICPSFYLPQGYIAVVATGGPNSSNNPVAVRQHPNPAYQGLRQIPGNGPYPLQDSYFQRSFGTGVRYRGAACIVQVKASGLYTAPTWAWT